MSVLTNVLENFATEKLFGLTIASSIIYLFGQVASLIARNASAALRCSIWQLTNAAVLASVVWLFCVPGLPIGKKPFHFSSPAQLAVSIPSPEILPASVSNGHSVQRWNSTSENQSLSWIDSANTVTSMAPTRWKSLASPLLALLGAVWIGVSAILCCVLIQSLREANTSLRHALQPTPAATLSAFADAKRRLRTNSLNRVTLVVTERFNVPITIGILRPTVVLPTHYCNWSQQKLVMIFIHELAHVQRCDIVWQLIARLACCFAWFHPLIWRSAKMAIQEREYACDDRVLMAGLPATDYGQTLIEVAQSVRVPWNAAIGVASIAEPPILQRLRAVLADVPSRDSVGRLTWVAVGLVFVLLSFAVCVFRPFTNSVIAQEQEPQQRVQLANEKAQGQEKAGNAESDFKQLLKKEEELLSVYNTESPKLYERQMELDPRNLMAADYLEFEQMYRGSDLAFEAIEKLMRGASTMMHLTDTKASMAQDEAIEILKEHYLEHKKLSSVFEKDLRLDDNLLQIASERSPYAVVRAEALLTQVYKAQERIRVAGFPWHAPVTYANPLYNHGPHEMTMLRLRALDVSEERARTIDILKEIEKKYSDIPHHHVANYGVAAHCILNAMENVAEGKPAQELIATDIRGKEFRLSSLRGKIVVLTFNSESTIISQDFLNKSLCEKFEPSGVVFVAVVAVENVPKFAAIASEKNLRGTIIPELRNNQVIRMSWDVRTYPQTYLIDDDGTLVQYLDLEPESIERKIELLMP